MKKNISKLFLLVFSVIATFTVIECGLRVFKLTPKIFTLENSYVKLSPNPILGYELNPNDSRINSFGLKKPEINTKKRNDTYRIVALGDSITFGCCTEPLQKGYSFYLQESIKLPLTLPHEIEVINAGIPGYNTVQEAEFYKQKIEYLEPDFLILQMTLNDWMPKMFEFDDLMKEQNEYDQQVTHTFFSLAKKNNKLLWKSYIFQHMNYVLATQKMKNNQESQLSDNPQFSFDQTIDSWNKTRIIEEGLKSLQSYLKPEMKSKVLLILFPYFGNNLNDYPEIFTEEHEYIGRVAELHGFKILDLKSCFIHDFEKTGISSLAIDENDTVHPNDHGHRVAAQCITDYLQENFDFVARN